MRLPTGGAFDQKRHEQESLLFVPFRVILWLNSHAAAKSIRPPKRRPFRTGVSVLRPAASTPTTNAATNFKLVGRPWQNAVRLKNCWSALGLLFRRLFQTLRDLCDIFGKFQTSTGLERRAFPRAGLHLCCPNIFYRHIQT